MNVATPVVNRAIPSLLTSGSRLTFSRYWDWSLDASSDVNSTSVFDSPVFDPVTGFGGNGPYVEANATENVFNLTGRLGGGCVSDGPFTSADFTVNYPEPHCLTRDFIPWVMNGWTQQSLVDNVQSQPDYTTWARAVEGIPSFSEPNIHGGGHFGIGGVLGQMGDAYNSPGGSIPQRYLASVVQN